MLQYCTQGFNFVSMTMEIVYLLWSCQVWLNHGIINDNCLLSSELLACMQLGFPSNIIILFMLLLFCRVLYYSITFPVVCSILLSKHEKIQRKNINVRCDMKRLISCFQVARGPEVTCMFTQKIEEKLKRIEQQETQKAKNAWRKSV